MIDFADLLREVDRLRALEDALADALSDRPRTGVEAQGMRRRFNEIQDSACGSREDHYARGFRAGQEDARALAADEVVCHACGGTGRRRAP